MLMEGQQAGPCSAYGDFKEWMFTSPPVHDAGGSVLRTTWTNNTLIQLVSGFTQIGSCFYFQVTTLLKYTEILKNNMFAHS